VRLNSADEKTAAIFSRVSTKGQEDNYSFDTQEADSRTYASRMSLRVVHVFTFVESARQKEYYEREDLQELLNLVAAKAVDAIILGKLDRLTRKVGTLSAIWRTCKDNGVELHFADLGKADDTPMGKFFLQMLENVAELEADNINARMQGGKQTKIASG